MRHFILACLLFCVAGSGMGQFIPQPLNYPGPVISGLYLIGLLAGNKVLARDRWIVSH